jgi:hypothetical protein
LSGCFHQTGGDADQLFHIVGWWSVRADERVAALDGLGGTVRITEVVYGDGDCVAGLQ